MLLLRAVAGSKAGPHKSGRKYNKQHQGCDRYDRSIYEHTGSPNLADKWMWIVPPLQEPLLMKINTVGPGPSGGTSLALDRTRSPVYVRQTLIRVKSAL
jgi:hypothetical protein